MVYLHDTAQEAKLGIILGLMKLREARGNTDIAFAAGLPDHQVPRTVRSVMIRAVRALMSPYLKYDPQSELNEENLAPELAAFHERQLGVHFDASEIKVAPGSTPVLGAVAYVTQQPGKTAMVISPSYPLMELPIRRMGGKVDRSARLITECDDASIKDGRWHIDYDSVRQSLEKNRDTGTLLFLNFPGNPTGYAPTVEEYQQLAEVLLDDIKARKAKNLPTMTILEDIAYATMMHGDKQYYSLNRAVDDLRKSTAPENKERLDLLNDLEQSVIVAHSFSKAFAVAGDRAAYFASKNPQLLAAVYNQVIEFILTPSRGTLAALKGAMRAGEVDKESMEEYAVRLHALEEGLNRITVEWLNDKTLGANPKNPAFVEFIRKNVPVPARADAGFFSATNFNFLKGQAVDQPTIDTIRKDIKKLTPTLQKEFEGIFENNTINNSRDAALWMMQKANVVAIPMAPINDDDRTIRLRFSVGQNKVAVIDQALKQMKAAFERDLKVPSMAAAQPGVAALEKGSIAFAAQPDITPITPGMNNLLTILRSWVKRTGLPDNAEVSNSR